MSLDSVTPRPSVGYHSLTTSSPFLKRADTAPASPKGSSANMSIRR